MPAAWRPPSVACPVRAFRGLALAEQQVVGMALDPLAALQAERFRAGAPPAAWRLAAGLAGRDVIAGRVLGRAAVDLFHV